MNKKLVAQFMASVEVLALPSVVLDLDEMDELEMDEMIEQAVEFDFYGKTMYILPSPRHVNGIQQVDCYVLKGRRLDVSPYQPTLEEVSDILERQRWNGNWVDPKRVAKAMDNLSLRYI